MPKPNRVLLDLAGDIATFLGTLGVKAAQAARAAKTAAATTGQAKVAAEYLAGNRAKDVAKHLSSNLKDATADLVASRATQGGEKYTKDARKIGKGVKAMRSPSMQGGKSLLDISELLVSFLSPSKVADGMIKLAIGETPGETYKKQMANIDRTVRTQCTQLDKKIQRLRKEKSLVWS